MQGRHLKVSAPGKIILHGEHAVVYQKTAIALSLGLRTQLDLIESDGGDLTISWDKFLEKQSWKVDDFRDLIATVRIDEAGPETALDTDLLDHLARFVLPVQNGMDSEGDHVVPDSTKQVALISFLYIVSKLCRLTKRQSPPAISVALSSELPVGAGLGSSAAFAVCLTASLLSYFGIISCDPKLCDNVSGKLVPSTEELGLINHWAYLIEKIIHGTASGIDNTVSTYGGVIKYRNREMTRIKCCLKLDVAVVDTQLQRNTKKMVELVQRRKKLYPGVVDPILDSIDAVSSTAFGILQHGIGSPTLEEYEILTDLITVNQNLLCALGVSHPALDAICAASLKWGQAAKLTGAGGGGSAIVVFDPDLVKFGHLRQSLLSEFRSMGFRPQMAEIGGPGVLFHPVV